MCDFKWCVQYLSFCCGMFLITWTFQVLMLKSFQVSTFRPPCRYATSIWSCMPLSYNKLRSIRHIIWKLTLGMYLLSIEKCTMFSSSGWPFLNCFIADGIESRTCTALFLALTTATYQCLFIIFTGRETCILDTISYVPFSNWLRLLWLTISWERYFLP